MDKGTKYTVCLQHTLIDKRTTKLPLCRLVPTAWSTILHLLQRSKKAAVAPWSKAAKRAVGKHEEPSEDHSLHPGDRTAAGQQAGPSEGHSLHPVHRTAVGQQAGRSESHNLHPVHRTAVGQQAGPSKKHSLHPGHRTDHLRQDHAHAQMKK